MHVYREGLKKSRLWFWLNIRSHEQKISSTSGQVSLLRNNSLKINAQGKCQLKFVIILGSESNPAVQGGLPQRLREGLTGWKEGNFQSGLHHLEEKKTPESLRSVEDPGESQIS